MGGLIECVLYFKEASRAHDAQALLNGVEQESLRLQAIFNFYDPCSELSRLNESRHAEISGELAEVLGLALEFCHRFDGAYDVSLGRRFLARKRGKPEPDTRGTYRDIRLDGREVALGHPDLLLDLGSVAKGFLVDRLFDWLKERDVVDAFIDARGDMRISGWHCEMIEIQDPRGPGALGKPIRMENLAVATSGDYSQFVGDFSQSHLLGKKRFCSATVIAPTLALADALATGAMVASIPATRSVFDALGECSALLVDESGETTLLGAFRSHLVD